MQVIKNTFQEVGDPHTSQQLQVRLASRGEFLVQQDFGDISGAI